MDIDIDYGSNTKKILTFRMSLGDIWKILRMNQVINPLGWKLCLAVAEEILASLLKGHVA